MRDADGTADHVGYCENFVDLVGADAEFVAFAKVILDAIVAAKYHGCHKPQHFLGAHIEGAFLVGLVIEAPESLDHFVVVCEDALVHAGAVVIEFLYE